MPNVEEKIKEYQTTIEAAKAAKVRAEITIEQLTKKQQDLEAQMKEMGVTPETIDAEIQALDSEIVKRIVAADALIAQIKEVL